MYLEQSDNRFLPEVMLSAAYERQSNPSAKEEITAF
jgi:hypothetical protein